jgi:hypothetical protein
MQWRPLQDGQHWPFPQQRYKLDTALNSVHVYAGDLKRDLYFCNLHIGEKCPLFVFFFLASPSAFPSIDIETLRALKKIIAKLGANRNRMIPYGMKRDTQKLRRSTG